MTNQLLILKMQAILGGRFGDSQMQRRAVAMEYCKRCAETEDRLEQCVALIRSGREYAALQVAESSSLLDTVNTLMFPELGQWHDYCSNEELPLPVAFDMSQIELVNSLYSGEITLAHPLYRDYRRAMRLRKYDQALGIIKTISKINAYDAEAKREYNKLRKRVDSKLLARLSRALDDADEETVFNLCESLESDAEALSGNDVWRRAIAAKKSYEKIRARKRCSEIVEKLSNMDTDRDWRESIGLISEFNMLVPLFSPSDSDIELVERVSAESAVLQKNSIALEKARRARNMLVSELEDFSEKNSVSKLTSLTKLLSDAGECADADLTKRVLRRIASLKRSIFMRRFGLTAAWTAAALVLMCMVCLAYRKYEIFSDRADADAFIISLGQSSLSSREIGDLCASFPKRYPRLADDPRYTLKISQISHAAELAAEDFEMVSRTLGELERFDFERAAPAECDLSLAQFESLPGKIDGLPRMEKIEAETRYEKLSKIVSESIERRKLRLYAEIRVELEKYEKLLDEYEAFPKDKSSLDAEYELSTKKLRSMLESGSSVLKPHRIDIDRFNDISARLADTRSRYAKFDSLRNAIMSSRTLSEFFAACDIAASSLEAPVPYREKLSKILSEKNKIIAGQSLLFADMDAVSNLDDAREFSRGTFAESPSMLDSVYCYFLPRGTKVYSLGPMKKRNQKWRGGSETLQEINQISPGGSVARAFYRLHVADGKAPTGELLSEGVLTVESELGRSVIKLASEKSFLSALYKAAGGDADPVFKLRLEALIYRELDKNRTSSGLAFSPSALERRESVVRYSEGCTDCSWIFESRPRKNLIRAELYSKKIPNFEEEANLRLEAAKNARKNPMAMVGIADEYSKLLLFGKPKGGIWAVDKSGEFKRMGLASHIEEMPLAPLSPVFSERLSETEILDRAASAVKK